MIDLIRKCTILLESFEKFLSFLLIVLQLIKY